MPHYNRQQLLVEGLLGSDAETWQLYHTNVWFHQWIDMMALRILPEMVKAAKTGCIKTEEDMKIAINLAEKGPLIGIARDIFETKQETRMRE